MDPITLDSTVIFAIILAAVSVGSIVGVTLGYHAGVQDRRPSRRRVGRTR